jgi:putative NIF3 family GTP cyclohydrolase 1 type 2
MQYRPGSLDGFLTKTGLDWRTPQLTIVRPSRPKVGYLCGAPGEAVRIVAVALVAGADLLDQLVEVGRAEHT